jgi:prepilin peptidase CpaA
VSLLSITIRLLVLGALLWLAAFDLRHRRLPTKVILAVGTLFFVDALVIGMPAKAILAHVVLSLAVLLICAGLFAAKMLGGGDAKLAAVVFLWVGASLSVLALTLISLIGTVVSLVSLATQHMSQTHRSLPLRALAMFSGKRGVPYGVALSLGGGSIIALPAILHMLSTR